MTKRLRGALVYAVLGSLSHISSNPQTLETILSPNESSVTIQDEIQRSPYWRGGEPLIINEDAFDDYVESLKLDETQRSEAERAFNDYRLSIEPKITEWEKTEKEVDDLKAKIEDLERKRRELARDGLIDAYPLMQANAIEQQKLMKDVDDINAIHRLNKRNLSIERRNGFYDSLELVIPEKATQIQAIQDRANRDSFFNEEFLAKRYSFEFGKASTHPGEVLYEINPLRLEDPRIVGTLSAYNDQLRIPLERFIELEINPQLHNYREIKIEQAKEEGRYREAAKAEAEPLLNLIAIGNLNKMAVTQIASLLPEEESRKYIKLFDERSAPWVYMRGPTEDLIDFALTISTTASQEESLGQERALYTSEINGDNRKFAKKLDSLQDKDRLLDDIERRMRNPSHVSSFHTMYEEIVYLRMERHETYESKVLSLFVEPEQRKTIEDKARSLASTWDYLPN